MRICPKLADKDRMIEGDKRTMREIRKIANTICPMVEMVEDYLSAHMDGKLPILDIQVYVKTTRSCMSSTKHRLQEIEKGGQRTGNSG